MGMQINLTPEQERLIRDELEAGHYQTVEQVIAGALQALHQRERHSAAAMSSNAQKNAVRSMLEFVARNSVRLEGVSVKELIHEGHRL